MLLLTNHIGYESTAPKQAILQTKKARLSSTTALLVCADNHITVGNFDVVKQGRVANWHQGQFFTIDFSSVTDSGRYYLRFDNLRSEVFEIGSNLLMNHTFLMCFITLSHNVVAVLSTKRSTSTNSRYRPIRRCPRWMV